MIRLIIDIEEDPGIIATKEAVAMALEYLGKVKVQRVIQDGKEKM